MADFLGPLFLSATAHATMLFCAFFNKASYVYASLPLGEALKEELEDFDASISVCLAVSLAFTLLEILFLFRQIPSSSNACYSLLSHVIACIFLLKFTIDIHPVSHFWYLFGFGTVPTLLIQIIILVNSYNKRKFC